MLSGISMIGYVIFVISVFSVDDLRIISAASAVFLILMVVLPHRQLKTGTLPICIFLAVTFFANVLFNTGKILYRAGPVVITEEGLYTASVRTLRIFLLVAGAKFLTVITTIEEMISAMGSIFGPLDKIKIPVKDFFDTMSLSVKALPLIKRRLSGEYLEKMGSSGKKDIREKIAIVFRFLLPVFFESINNPESLFREDRKNGVEGR